jgi:hypothetical protein
MAVGNIVRIVPSHKSDASLVAHCQTFSQLEAEFVENDTAQCNQGLGTWSPAQVERWDELERLVETLCARSLSGIAARVRTLLHVNPRLFEPSDEDFFDMRLVSALLRDLRTVLKVDDADDLAREKPMTKQSGKPG